MTGFRHGIGLRPDCDRRRQRRPGLRAARGRIRRARAAGRNAAAWAAPASIVGCVPKKIMWNAGELAHALRDAAGYGFDITLVAPRLARCSSSCATQFIGRLNAIYERNLEQAQGRAAARPCAAAVGAVDPGRWTRSAVGRQHRARQPAAGRSSRTLPGAQLGISSDGFFELERAPDSVAVVGAGYIAAELSGIFAALGSRTTRGLAPRVHAAAFRCDARRSR